jgi:hypothetical protein
MLVCCEAASIRQTAPLESGLMVLLDVGDMNTGIPTVFVARKTPLVVRIPASRKAQVTHSTQDRKQNGSIEILSCCKIGRARI